MISFSDWHLSCLERTTTPCRFCAVPANFLPVVWRLTLSAALFPAFCGGCYLRHYRTLLHFSRFVTYLLNGFGCL